MTDEELNVLVRDCPYLYHMAMRQSWPSIQRHGLLPTNLLLDLWEIEGDERRELITRRRPVSVTVSHPKHGEAVVRDQIPMHDHHLAKCLRDGLTPRDWHERLNERVFFWLTDARLERLLCANAYKRDEHIVLKVDTASVISEYRDRIELCPMNSGCTMPYPHPRGVDTFLPINKYPYAQWREKRSARETVVELTVIGGAPNIIDHVEEVSVRTCGATIEVLYSRA
ncbi:DUF7002 family protein [Mesorhizobium mediterraneum]|uniref:DUF7002 family protein n=1 Tax=Mesorhizobium mediterraneum TaxID=43617 RepID=UPI00177F8522|nr:hypothetical protein [Mesorhizobium mediterraneum]